MRQDQHKWDFRYKRQSDDIDGPDPFLEENVELLGRGGLALDLACGTGRNALFLAQRGFTVEAIDISMAALSILQKQARMRQLPISCVAADLDEFPLPQGRYDLAVVFNFYDPRLFPGLRVSIRPGGLIVYATFNERHLSEKPEFNPAYLVASDSLASHFPTFHILINEPQAGESGNISRLVARRPCSEEFA